MVGIWQIILYLYLMKDMKEFIAQILNQAPNLDTFTHNTIKVPEDLNQYSDGKLKSILGNLYIDLQEVDLDMNKVEQETLLDKVADYYNLHPELDPE